MFGRGNIGVAPLPGQYITGKTGGPGELSRILRKTLALYGVVLATFAAWAVIVLALGPTLVGAVVLLYGAIWLYTAAQEAEHPPNWAIVVVLEIALLSLAWGWVTTLAEPTTVAWWPAPFEQRIDQVNRYWRLTFVLIAVGWLSVRRKVQFRLSVEITHPTFPPPLEARPGWEGPIDENTEFLPPPTPQIPVPEPVIRTVSRPIPVYQNGTLVGDTHGGNGAGSDSQFAPSGREVPNDVLRQFVRGSYRHNTAYVNTWRQRGWEYSKWKDTVDLLAIFGITSELRERTKTRLLPPTQEAALARLEQYLN